MDLKITTQKVEVKTRKLKTKFTLEALQDLELIHDCANYCKKCRSIVIGTKPSVAHENGFCDACYEHYKKNIEIWKKMKN